MTIEPGPPASPAENADRDGQDARRTILNIFLTLGGLALLVMNVAVSIAVTSPSGNPALDFGFLCGRVLFFPLFVVGLVALWKRTRALTYLLIAFVMASSCSFCLSLSLLGNQLMELD